jgi:hypothetical protein
MSFGTQGVIAPAGTALLRDRNPADAPAKAGTPAAPAPAPVDTVARGKAATTDPNAYHQAIAKINGGSGAATHARAASVADMSLTDKISTTVRAGIAGAAKDASGSLKTALSDPKTDAVLAGGAGAVVAAQFVPGLDVAVDATLGTVGVATYAAAAPEHRDNITHAFDKLKDYASEVGSAKTQADLDKASKDFADFIKLGGSEAIDAAGTLAGGVAGAGKVVDGLEAAGGIDAIGAGASKSAGDFLAKGDELTERLVQGLGGGPDLAIAGGGRLEMRTAPEAIRPSGSSGTRASGGPSPEGSAGGAKATTILEGKNPDTLTGLHPNATYEFQGGFTYVTDAQGRVKQVEATLTPGAKPGVRSGTLQRKAGGVDRLSTDEGGHLIATRFNGPSHEVNHIAQDIQLNRGDFKKLENKWANDLEAGKTVNVKIELSYPKDSQRPSTLRVRHDVDGFEQRPLKFANEVTAK